MPEDLLWVEEPVTKKRLEVIPGELRPSDVEVGGHVAISPPAVPRFLQRFEEVYGRLGKTETLLAAAAAHHCLVWIHPFLDGNGRVARLMSHATLLEALDTGAVWSIARGLARNVNAYKDHLAACDQTRRNDLDGRGHLSEENLAEFTRFFLTTCIDQVNFMERLMQPDQLRTRILLWAEEEIRLDHLSPKSGSLLEAVLYRGELPRADATNVVGTGERQARRCVSLSPRHSPRAGCPVCSRKGLDDGPSGGSVVSAKIKFVLLRQPHNRQPTRNHALIAKDKALKLFVGLSFMRSFLYEARRADEERTCQSHNLT